MRIFVDTNVLVSALATRGLCTDLLQILIAEHELLIGEVVLTELERILTRKLKIPPDAVARHLKGLRRHTVIPKPAALSEYEVRDADDSLVLASALVGEADILVTGDKDLLSIREEVHELSIVDPRGLWEQLRGMGTTE